MFSGGVWLAASPAAMQLYAYTRLCWRGLSGLPITTAAAWRATASEQGARHVLRCARGYSASANARPSKPRGPKL